MSEKTFKKCSDEIFNRVYVPKPMTDQELDAEIERLQGLADEAQTDLDALYIDIQELKDEKQRRWEAKLTPKDISN
jgi:hypothetical protein